MPNPQNKNITDKSNDLIYPTWPCWKLDHEVEGSKVQKTQRLKYTQRAEDLIFDTHPRWKRICLTIIEFIIVLAVLFMFCYAHHLVEVLAQ